MPYFYGIGTMCLNFGRNDIMREGINDFRNGLILIGEIFHKLCGNEDRVVKAVPVIAGNEDMTAAFACKLAVELVEFGFDIRVTGLPHDGNTTVCVNNVFQRFGTFYVVNNLCAGFLFKKLFLQ